MAAFPLRGDQDILYYLVGSTWTAIPGVKSFQDNQPSKTQIDANDLNTPKGVSKSVSGRPGGSHTMVYTINYDPTNAVHQALKLASTGGTIFSWLQLMREDDGTTACVWTFSGEIASLPVSGSDNQIVQTTLTVNCESTPNYDATLPAGITADRVP